MQKMKTSLSCDTFWYPPVRRPLGQFRKNVYSGSFKKDFNHCQLLFAFFYVCQICFLDLNLAKTKENASCQPAGKYQGWGNLKNF